MKKYTLFLFALAFALGLFNINVSSVSAQVAVLPDGCTTTSGYSTTTGLPCDGSTKLKVSIIGNKNVYAPNENISLQVKGVEIFDGGPGEPSEGFNVQVYLTGIGNNTTSGVNATYNSQTSYWDAQFPAPTDSSKTYKVEAFFYCADGSLACGQRYSPGIPDSQVSTSFYFLLSTTKSPFITVVSPNGGEIFKTGNSYPIKWQTKNLPRDSKVRIDVRGWSYPLPTQTIATVKASDLSYRWTVPSSLPSGDYRIQIYHIGKSGTVSDGLTKAISQNSFIINSPNTTPPSITVLSPNGGESFVAGGNLTGSFWSNNLTVGTTYEVALVGQGYDRDIGYGLIGSTSVDKQTISVTIPSDVPAKENFYRLRLVVGCAGGLCVQDQSDLNFTITAPTTQPSITVVSPNGGEVWQTGSVHRVSWTNNTGKNVRVELLKGNNYINDWGSLPSTSSVYDMPLSSFLQAGSDYKVRVTSLDAFGAADNQYFDDSDSSFTITSSTNPSITVLAPNGGEIWVKGTTQNITWKDIITIPTYVPMSYDIGLIPLTRACPIGQICPIPATSVIAKGVFGSSYRWSVGKLSSGLVSDGNYSIQVCRSGTSVCDESERYFKITSDTTLPSITLISQDIAAVASDNGDFATGNFKFKVYSPSSDIYISRVSPHQEIVEVWFGGFGAGTANTATLTATSPSTGTDDENYYTIKEGETRSFNLSFSFGPSNGAGFYKAKAISLINKNANPINFGSEFTTSNVYLRGSVPVPTSSATVLAPNGGEDINLSNTLNALTVTFKPIIGANHYINLVDESKNSAYSLDSISGGNGITGQSTNQQSFSVIIPPNLYSITSGSQFKIEICANSICDKSDNYFTITSPTIPSVTVLAPNGGENWYTQGGSLKGSFSTSNIPNGTSCTVAIVGGSTNVTIATVTKTLEKQVFLATIPSDIATAINYRVRVTCGGASDESDGTITVNAGAVLGAEAFHFTQFLQQGSSGNEVAELQKFLNASGYDAGNTDGKFGSRTKEALIAFQIANNLKADGIVGFEVRSFLNR